MAYDRYDTRDERSRWREDRPADRSERDWRGGDPQGRRDERGFFERAGDEIASWFGDDDAERRRSEDDFREGRGRGWSGHDRDRERSSGNDWNRDRYWSDETRRDRGRNDWFETRGTHDRGGFGQADYNRNRHRELSGPGDRERDYRPLSGDYGRSRRESEQFFAASGVGRGQPAVGDLDLRGDRWEAPWGRDDYRRNSRAGASDWSDRSRPEDPHYSSWRQRHMDELDRDYDDYRREHQSQFESDFGSWRERRQSKRGLLGQIREHMEVVGSDDQHVGKVDKCAGDRIILAKSDPESGGAHHSLSCSEIDRVEGDRVILDCSAEQARQRWRDESRSRALFERDDQGEMGPRMLDRSFEGTYR